MQPVLKYAATSTEVALRANQGRSKLKSAGCLYLVIKNIY